MGAIVNDWAARWGIPSAAIDELRAALGVGVPQPLAAGRSEAYVQSAVRLEAGRKGCQLFRNNLGAMEDKTGRVIRYGLANDSRKMNETVKSSDLVGWRTVTITPEMVGQIIAQTVVRECKPEAWTWTGTDHEWAQLRWLELVTLAGGDARFATGEGTL